ncbi:hypothetical protein C7974DRAFT_28110 [Boeremia exigua]|uniref:uncharacterized protein n=1 Tax=Boeremia exigua TaxID=749465 RepID=UPI001E8EE033|nr:uncharacterized protein C7974DRAFT_28110 [Boeremia exigua]KAH6644799.1 hypothetical protein C7974DRAFT_28110 [Boeremia exigua]
MSRKKQGLRSFHHKSRNGCTRCKRRKVKCNMQAPSCGNCNRRNETCEYQRIISYHGLSRKDLSMRPVGPVYHSSRQETRSLTPIKDYWPTASGCGTGSYVHQPSTESTFFWLAKAVLDQSWFTTAESSLWATALSTEAKSSPYLYHCIFSLTSLQPRQPGQPDSRDPISAYKHHVHASELFRLITPVTTEHNWLAVVAFQVFVLVFELTAQTNCAKSEFNIVNTLEVFRWNSVIGRDAVRHFKNSNFWQLIVKRTTGIEVPPDPALQASLQSLGCAIADMAIEVDNDSNEEQSTRFCQEAYKGLCAWVDYCAAWPRRFDHYYYWPLTLKPQFLDVLAKGNETALLLVMYWSIVLWRSPMPAVWKWAHRAALCTLQSLQGKAKWNHLLAWPLYILATAMPRDYAAVKAV